MKDIIKAAQALLDYIEENDVINKASLNERDDHDQWAAIEFQTLVEDLKNVIPKRDPLAQALIRACFNKLAIQP